MLTRMLPYASCIAFGGRTAMRSSAVEMSTLLLAEPFTRSTRSAPAREGDLLPLDELQMRAAEGRSAKICVCSTITPVNGAPEFAWNIARCGERVVLGDPERVGHGLGEAVEEHRRVRVDDPFGSPWVPDV